MEVLLIYRSGIAKEEFRSSFNKYSKDNITTIVEHNVVRNLMKYFYPEVKFITKEELFKGEIDHMKFDYIVGNPPYQYPKGAETSRKLYIDITAKVIPLLKKTGVLSFITPMAILNNGSKNTVYNLIKDNIYEVDMDIDKQFNVGQRIILWNMRTFPREGKIKLLRDDEITYKESISKICLEKDEILIEILDKVNYKKNNRAHLKINDTSNEKGMLGSELSLEKDDEYNIEVISSSQRNRIKYAKDVSKQTKEIRIIIPMQGGYRNGCEISDKPYSNGLMINSSRSVYSLDELENMKKYLESHLISFCVENYNIVFPKASYAFLFLLPEINFNISYTDEELYKEFNITEDEQEEIENWYSEWID